MRSVMQKKSRILLLLPMPPPFAGPEIVAKGMVDSFASLGFDDYQLINSTLKRTNREKGKISTSGILAFISVLRKYISLLPHVDVVYMYLCSGRIGFLRDSIYILLGYIFRKKVVVHYHAGKFYSFFEDQSYFYKYIICSVLKKVKAIFVLGDSLKWMFEKILPYKHIYVLRNGIDTALFPTRKKTSRNTFTVFFMGHLTFPKGFYDLIYAYKSLYSKYGDSLRFVFAGERVGFKLELKQFLNPEWSDYYVANIDTINSTIEGFIDSCTNFNSYYLGVIGVNEKVKALHDADLLVLPSHTEGLSMSCIEAMSVGLPVVTTPVGAMTEIVIHGKGGLITKVGDPELLAQNIEKLFLDRELAQRMGVFNTEFVTQHLNILNISNSLHQQLTNFAQPFSR